MKEQDSINDKRQPVTIIGAVGNNLFELILMFLGGGAMCYWALVGIAYYEWYEDNPGASSWPGEIGPTASASQLKAAQKAWEAVVRARRYRLT